MQKFDGDEMNMHVPQSIQTMMELKYLAAVQHHFISPSNNSPIIAPSQDNLLGAFLMTADDIELTQSESTHLLSGTQAFNGILPEPNIIEGKRVRWTGKQIYSIILPPLTMKGPTDTDFPFVVENGIIKSGRINKSVSNMLIQSIHSEFGSTETARYINDLQYVISRFLIKTGFSIGISDMLIHKDIKKYNKERLMKVFEDEKELMRKVHLNILDDNGTGNFSKVYETKCMKLMNDADNDVADNTMAKLSLNHNRVKTIVASGAKGKKLNIKQMVCLLGQQVIEGGRVPMGFNDRTLPHYSRYENGLESRGFITGNFIDGINPQEFFFHAISGRIGLIDTAVKTAKSGYLQRRLVKMMEDLRAYHDSSIRDANNNVIEFCYGTDGFDGMKLEGQKTKLAFINKDDLVNNYLILEKDGEDMKDYVLTKTVSKMKKEYPDWIEKCNEYNKALHSCLDLLHVEMVKIGGEVKEKLLFPANINKLISKAKIIYGLEDCKIKSNIHFIDVINRIEQCLDDCSIKGQRNNVLMILLYDYLSPKKVLRDYKFNADALEFVCSQIYLGFQKGLVNPGEMVGPVAAQSIGEQSTQMTLNSVVFETSIKLLNKDGQIEHVEIGKYIDDLLDNNKSKIKHIPKNRTQYLELDKEVLIDSCDMDGNVKQCKVSAITKHLPIGDLVKIKTNSGREVIATQQKSFLIFDSITNKLVETEGINLKIDDLIPINNKFTKQYIKYLDLSKILNKKSYIFGSDFHKAKDLYLNDKRKIKFGFWNNNGNIFTLPYGRVDTFTDVIKGKKCKNTEIKAKYVYPKFCHKVVSLIPEKIILDNEFGFICGIYLAEGWVTKTFVGISNNDLPIINKIKLWCDKLKITYHVVVTKSKRFINSKSTDIKLHSVVLANIFKELFSTGSHNKYIHNELLNGNDDFIKGVIDGYISGDGTISKKDKAIIVSSASKKLLEDISYLLQRLGILGKLSGHTMKNNNVGSKNIKFVNTLSIRNNFAKLFSNNINLSHDEKNNKLDIIKTYKFRNSYGMYKIYNNVILDPIISIEYIKPTEEQYVYDLTVPETLNFGLANGIMMRDTFHTAGTGAKVTAGVPRMEEILSVTANLKTPSNVLYLKNDNMFNKDKAEVVKNSIAQVTIGKILKGDPEFYLEPSNNIENVLEEDKDFMKFYELFSDIEGDKKEIKENPWIIRLEFDRKQMINYNISMSDINLILQHKYPESILMYSDDNAGKLVFRIKMPFETKYEVEDDIKLLKGKVEEFKSIIIKGVDNIKSAFLNNVEDKSDKNDYIYIEGKKGNGFSNPGDVYVSKKEYVITTEGSNLFELLLRDDVDENRSYTIEPNEMWSIYGIEACKFVILQQFMNVLTDSGVSINPRHVCLLVNKMIHGGEPYAINFYGVSKEETGPLAKASFERPMEVFKMASLFGEIDRLQGVSANIMVGQIPNCGTGSVKCYLDEETLMEGLKKKGITQSQEQTGMTEAELLKEFEDRICVSEDDKIKINMTDVNEDGINLDMIPTITVE